MGNNLDVSITANVADLQAKFAVARAEYLSLGQEMNKLAKQSAAGVIDPAGEQQLQQVAADFVHAKAEAANLGAELKKTSNSLKEVGESAGEGIGGALEDIRGKFATAFEFTGAAAAVEAFRMVGEAIEHVGEKATQIQTTSEMLGVTTDQIQAMEAASKEVGTSMDVFARAAERLNTLLFDARNNSGTAVEKLRDLGVTTAEIADPTFKINQLLQDLRERLIDSSTHQQTLNELVKEFGPRAALAAAAIEKYDGSAKGVAETLARINGLSQDQIQKAHEMGVSWDEVGTAYANSGSKGLIWLRDVGEWMERNSRGARQMAEAIGAPLPEQKLPEKQVGIIDRGAAQQDEEVVKDVLKDIQKQEMDNAKAGVEAFKEGTREKLAQLQVYAAAARAFYGSDEVDAVVKANQQIIAQQRAVDESDQRFKEQQMQREQRLQSARLAAITKQIETNTQWFQEEVRTEEELYGGWATTYAEINNRHAQLLHEQAAATARNAKEQVKTWQSMVGEIENAEGTLVSDLLNRRKSLAQSLLSIGSNLVTQEIANDIRAYTTRMLLGATEAAQTKALEQGGLLYHLSVEAHKAAATHASEAAQTGATVAGNATRLSAQTSAAAASKAVSADVGKKTVMQDAAKAFSGTYASVAQIPYVGWILAPVAASAAFAGVAAYEGLASLDTGTNYVPQDMIAQIHEGEQIVPKQYNPAANPALATAGAGYSEEHHYNGDVNISHADLGRMIGSRSAQRQLIKSIATGLRRGAKG